ncbi:ImmA/IrrE family metallo-endopeptidase [Patescibacteria group bacterium]|nr:ImmA/IrrE family metallo-endopeptidase [Patescibacteria group bacterium]
MTSPDENDGLQVNRNQEVQFERGFKSWAENTAISLRKRLGLSEVDPLGTKELTSYLAIKIWTLNDIPNLSVEAKRYLLSKDGDEWSAITLREGNADVIIINSSHSPRRQASDIAHECAHILRGHSPAKMMPIVELEAVLREYNDIQEAEANWLAGCLLLPRPVLSYCAARRMSEDEVCIKYNVSSNLYHYRVNVSGVKRQFSRYK